MAICSINQNILRDTACGYTLGATNYIYLLNFGEVSAVTVDTSSGQVVSDITFNTGGKAYKMQPLKNSASWTDELVVADDGTKHRTHTVNFNLNAAYDANGKLVDSIDALSLGKYIAVIAKSDGSYVMLGRTAGLEATVVTVGGSDDNSTPTAIQITLAGDQAESALPLNSTAIAEITSF